MNVLFVCMGNICRSPMAEGAMRKKLAELSDLQHVSVDSAGTHSYHASATPDSRAQAAAARRGIDISSLQARKVVPADFERFDYILAMDNDNLAHLLRESDQRHHGKIELLLNYSDSDAFSEVPDPYYGGAQGFERVLDMVQEATAGFVQELQRRERLERRRTSR